MSTFLSDSSSPEDASFGQEEKEYTGVKKMPTRAERTSLSASSNRRDAKGDGAAVLISQSPRRPKLRNVPKQFAKESAFEFSHSDVPRHSRAQPTVKGTPPDREDYESPQEDQKTPSSPQEDQKTPSRKYGTPKYSNNGLETSVQAVRSLFNIGPSHAKRLANYKEQEEGMKHALNDALARCAKAELSSSRRVNEVAQLRVTILEMDKTIQQLTKLSAVQAAELSAANTTALKLEDAVAVARAAADQHATAAERALSMGTSITSTMAELKLGLDSARTESTKILADELADSRLQLQTATAEALVLQNDLETSGNSIAELTEALCEAKAGAANVKDQLQTAVAKLTEVTEAAATSDIAAAEQAKTAAQALGAEQMRNATLVAAAAARLEEAATAKTAAAAAESECTQASDEAADQTAKQQLAKIEELEASLAAANTAAAKLRGNQAQCEEMAQEAKSKATEMCAALQIQQQATAMKKAANDELEFRISSQHAQLIQADEISNALRKQFAHIATENTSKFEEQATKHANELASAEQVKSKLKSDTEVLKAEAADRGKAHALLTEELRTTERELQAQIVTAAVRDAKISEASARTGRLTQALESVRTESAEHQGKGRQLAFELETVQGQLDTAKAEIASSHGALETATTDTSATVATLAETRSLLASATAELNSTKAELEAVRVELARSVAHVEGANIVAEREAARFEEVSTDLRARSEELQQKTLALESCKGKLAAALEKEEVHGAREAARFEEVSTDLRARSEELQQKTLALESCKGKLAAALEKEEVLNATLSIAQAGGVEQQRAIARITDGWTDAKCELNKVRVEGAAQHAQLAAQLDDERANAATVLAEVEAFSRVELTEATTASADKMAAVTAQMAEELAAVKSTLEAELAEERAAVEAANEDNAELNANVVTLETKLAAAEAEIATLKDLMGKASADVAAMTATLEETREELMVLRATDAYAALAEMTALYKREAHQRKYLHNKLRELRGNIQVFCRIRPDPSANLAKEVVVCPDFSHKVSTQVSAPYVGYIKQSHKYEFDRVFAAGKHPTSQEDVFKESTEPMITAVLDGYNVAVIAYGQTGTGKTHTMMGTEDDPGVTFRSVNHLLINCKANKNVEYTITVSMLEVYLDKLVDLLSSNPVEKQSCGIKGGRVEGLTQREVTSTEEVLAIMTEGKSNRKVASTAMNSESSRSHLVVFITVAGYNSVSLISSSAKLTLVDLAGSERMEKSPTGVASKHNVAKKLAETVSINKSLTCLGQIFSSIHEGSKHVPYRNSKLTHVLQDVLTADTKVCIFVHVSSSEDNLGESHSTMKFGKTIGTIEQNKLKQMRQDGGV